MSENNEDLLEFPGGALLERVKEELPGSYVEQTGGGTATLMCFKGTGEPGQSRPGEVRISAGPGSFDWDKPDESVFNSGEFAFGREAYDSDGNEFPDEAPSEWMDPENPDLDSVAQRIIAAYHEYNPEVVAPEDPEEDPGLATRLLPGNPFAAVVDNTSASVRETAALLTIAYELRTGNIIQARKMEDAGMLDYELGARMNIKPDEIDR